MKKVEGSKVYRLLYPAVPAIIAASTRENVAAMPVASLISLSNDPAMIAFSSSPAHRTYATVIEAGCFSVCWLDHKFSEAVEVLGSTTGRAIDKLEAAGLHHTRGKILGVPVLDDAAAYLECRFAISQRFGDHNLVVGEVKNAEAVEDFHDYWEFREYSPMLYTGMQRPFGQLSGIRLS